MMQDWNSYRAALQERVGDFASLNPDVMAGLAKMNQAVAKPGSFVISCGTQQSQ